MARSMRRWIGLAVLFAVVPLTACGLTMPSDPNGSLSDVRGGTLRVGVSENPPFSIIEGDEMAGSEVDAIEAFADTLDARIEWTVGSEESLVRELEAQTIDVAIAGFTDATPWADQAGVTRPYAEVTDASGERYKVVMLVQNGENAFLSELETFLAEYTGEIG